tara:strand:- start:31720 stop:31893 length:174 start_codon:yes stop_codon:yes gene_type:complete
VLSNPDQLNQVLTYNGPGGAVDTITAGPDNFGNFYRQTLTYTGTNVTNVSAWVKVVS